MKINKIYLSSYILLFIIFTPLWFFLAPSVDDFSYVQLKNEVTYVEVGNKIPIDHSALRKKYDYDEIKVMDLLNDSDEDEIFIENLDRPMYLMNYRNDIIANRHGLAVYIIVLYKYNQIVQVVNLGYHVQYVKFDQNDAEWIPLNQQNFQTMLEQYPNGKYYLEEDINLEQRTHMIDKFSGILVNPYEYVITGLKQIDYASSQGLFYELNNAIIDGIIITNASFDMSDTDNPQILENVGFITSKSFRSFISNVNVTGDIDSENYGNIGGLVGSSMYSLYRYVSFTGTIGNSGFVGGIVGKNSGLTREISSLSNLTIWTDVITIENAYVDADLTSFAVAGFIGNHFDRNLLRLKSVYVTGSIDRSHNIDPASYYIGYLFNNPAHFSGWCEFENAYTTETFIADSPEYDGDQVKFILQDQLFGTTPLEGLETFIFSTEDIPRLAYWEIGS